MEAKREWKQSENGSNERMEAYEREGDQEKSVGGTDVDEYISLALMLTGLIQKPQ